MTQLRQMTESLRRAWNVAATFIWIGWLRTVSYPLSFITDQLASLAPVAIYYFVADLVGSSRLDVGADYYTFVIIGVAATRVLAGGLRGVGEMLEEAINEGRLEALLIQPVSWKYLPLGLVQWPIIWRLVNVSVLVAMSLAFGAHYQLSGVLVALIVIVLGIGATMAVGVVAASVKVLAKRTDPVLTVYALVASVLAGVYFPVGLLPGWLQFISRLLPDTYVVSALRHSLMPSSHGLSGPTPAQAIVGLTIFNLVVFPFGIWLFSRALEYGRRVGVLSAY